MSGEVWSAGSGHHLTLRSSSRYGSWATCACGWKSGTYANDIRAHLAFGRHLTTTPTTPVHDTESEAL